jgi:hypothetical protein
MELTKHSDIEISHDLPEAIHAFPTERIVEHCGVRLAVSPFDLYANCPECGVRIKLRAFSAGLEIEDVFDAVFAWMNSPKAQALALRRQEDLREEEDLVEEPPAKSR